MLQQSLDPLADSIAFSVELGKVTFEPVDAFGMRGELGVLLTNLNGLVFKLNFKFQRMFFCGMGALLSGCAQLPFLAEKIDCSQHTLFESLESCCLEVRRVGCVLLELYGWA